MIKASDLPKPVIPNMEDYLQERISGAVEKGYPSCLAWIKKSKHDEASKLLVSNGYEFSTLKEKDDSIQLEIRW